MRVGKYKLPVRRCGYTYVMILGVLAIFSVGLVAVAEVWSNTSRREKENELLQVGQGYVDAIRRYYQSAPGILKRYPTVLQELTEDKRFAGTSRYLRRVYPDPVSADGVWGLIKAPDGGIMGVYSTSTRSTLRQRRQALSGGVTAVNGDRYCDWKFFYKVN